METDCNGLLLLLKKRRLQLSEADTNASQFHYLIFGSFDALQIIPISKWKHQRPDFRLDLEASGIYNEAGNPGFPERDDSGDLYMPEDFEFSRIPYVSSFILRALRPSIGCTALTYPNYAVSAPDKPFCALMLLRYTHSLCRSMESGQALTEWMAQQLDACPVLKDRTVECSLFESLGYYDAILILRARSPKPLEAFCTYVRGLKKEGIEAVSACYAMLGLQNPERMSMDARSVYSAALENAQEDIEKVRISFQLRSSGSTPLTDLSTENIRALNGYRDLSVSVPGENSRDLFERYFFHGEMSPGALNASVLNTNTHIYANRDPFAATGRAAPAETAGAEPGERNADRFPFESAFWKTYIAYVKHRQEEDCSLRLATALRQTVLRFQNLVSSDHCFDLKSLAMPVFEALYENMKLANRYLDEQAGRIAAASEDKKGEYRAERLQFWASYDAAVKNFRDMVGRYISDLSLSDTHFIEDSHLKYPSVGTAAKFIFVYQYFIRELAITVTQEETDQYRFLVKSGGQDGVYVTNIFNDLWHRDTISGPPQGVFWDLLVIDIPEKLLYDIPTALFSLTHEAFHVVGNRSRRLRARRLCEAASNFIGSYLDILFFERSFVSINEYIALLLKKEETREIAKRGASHFRSELRKKIVERLIPVLSGFDEETLMSVHLEGELEELCRELLSGPFKKEILSLKWEALRVGITQWCSEQDDNAYLSRYIMAERLIRDRERLSRNHTSQSDAEKEEQKKEQRILESFISCLLGSATEIPVNEKDFEDDINRKSQEDYLTYVHSNIISVLNLCIDATQEGFSDIMLIRTLELDWCSYIICLLSTVQSSNPDMLLANTEKTVLRLGSVLECAFSKKGTLDDSDREELRERMASCFSSAVIEKLIERLNVILTIYAERYGMDGNGNGIAPPICSYLKQSTDSLYGGLGDNYRQVAADLRAFAAANTVEERKAQVMNYWLKLAKEA